MKKLIVGNWKMNFNPAEASLLVNRLDQKVEVDPNVTVVFCPPFIDLYPISKELNHKKFKLGSQNVHYLDHGPYTGEISPAMLKGLVDYAIVGHSERRQHAGEDDKLIAKKVAATVRHRITPILCVGDTLADHENGHAKKVVNDQVTADLSLLTSGEVAKVVIAYEPVWAISTGDGHGKHATPDEVAPVVASIRSTVGELFGDEVGQNITILYGGSVNPDDVKAYLKMDGVDGALVGGASLNFEEFASIVKSAQTV
jgi:triosephosphate isomerase (TIM)